MPIYEYTCKECSKTFPRLQKIGADAAGITCPTCKSDNVERNVSTFSGGSATDNGSPIGASAPSCTGFT